MRDSAAAALIAALFWTFLAVLSAGNPRLAGVEAVSPFAAVSAADSGPEAPAPAGSDCPPPAATIVTEAFLQAEQGFDEGFLLPVLRDGEPVRMPLHDYLTGVILAEMPLSFPDEALKAQAVASRTYALRHCAHPRHGEAAVCTDSGCCQGWQDPSAAAPSERERAESLVQATDGLVIRYEGKLIEATFFSCSGGRTEDAAAVWGGELPYLQAVDSPGEEEAAHFSDETRIPLDAFRAALRGLDPAVEFPEALGAWVGSVSRTPGGGVDEIVLGGRPFTGKQLRKTFGLRSTAFSLELSAGEAVFVTHGFGHRVGMSQYGAAAMARAGADFREILQWYYQGVRIGPAE